MIGVLLLAAALCLPPGVSLEGLSILHVATMFAPIDGDEQHGEQIQTLYYGTVAWGPNPSRTKYVVYRLEDRTIAVDDHPGELVADWVLDEVVTLRGALRPVADRRDGCTWHRGGEPEARL